MDILLADNMYKVYVKGFVGNFGTKVLIEKKNSELKNYFNEEFLVNTLKQIEDGGNPSLFFKGDKEVRCIDSEPVGKGGVLAALWKVCDRNKFGLKFRLCDIPILQGTIEIANYFDINPYRLLTKNAYLYILDLDKSDIIEESYDFRYIGDIVDGKQRIRVDNEAESFLTKGYKDEIDIVLKRFTREIKDE